MAKTYNFYDTEICQRMSDTLILTGKSESTRLAYLRQARTLADFYNKTPDNLYGSLHARISIFILNLYQPSTKPSS